MAPAGACVIASVFTQARVAIWQSAPEIFCKRFARVASEDAGIQSTYLHRRLASLQSRVNTKLARSGEILYESDSLPQQM